jgi:hypothetical protein
MGCGCIAFLLALIAPRIILLIVWLTTPYVVRALGPFLLPFLGLIFLPLTTLAYSLLYHPGVGVVGFGWFWVILAFLIDIGVIGGGGYGRRRYY